MEREIWRILYLLAWKLDSQWGDWRYSTTDVLGVYFWAVVNDRPTSWAADPGQWPDDLRPLWLPPQCTLSRRLRQPKTVELMTAVEEHLLALVVTGSCLVQVIDGKALAVSGVSKDPDSGYGPGAGGPQKGYKLYAVWDARPMPTAWALAPMNVSEKTMTRCLIPTLPGGGYLLADTQYDVNALYDLAAGAGFQLVAKKIKDRGRGGLGHRRQSAGRLRSLQLLTTAFGRMLYRQRNAIERHFGAWTCFGGGLGPLPAWVRRFSRVRNWVQAKILVSGARWLLLHKPQTLAVA